MASSIPSLASPGCAGFVSDIRCGPFSRDGEGSCSILEDKMTGGARHQLHSDRRRLVFSGRGDRFVQQPSGGWSLQPDMLRDLVMDDLEMAWLQRSPDRNSELIFHSDRGSQDASQQYGMVLDERGTTANYVSSIKLKQDWNEA